MALRRARPPRPADRYPPLRVEAEPPTSFSVTQGFFSLIEGNPVKIGEKTALSSEAVHTFIDFDKGFMGDIFARLEISGIA